MNNAVQVCPYRGIECGHNSDSWCASCPKLRGLNYSIGGLKVVLDPSLDANQMRVSFGHSGSSADSAAQVEKVATLEKIRKLVNGPDLDGVLAKIRQLVNDCP